MEVKLVLDDGLVLEWNRTTHELQATYPRGEPVAAIPESGFRADPAGAWAALCHAIHVTRGLRAAERSQAFARLKRAVGAKRFFSAASQDALDELIHTVAGGDASALNNGGIEEQIDYLLAHGWSEEQIREEVWPTD